MSTARNKGTRAAWLTPALGGCVLLGAVAFVYGLIGSGHPLVGWQALHISYLYILGPTFAGVLISVIWELTSSKWGQNMKRIAESAVGVIPVVLIGYLGLAAAHHHMMEAGHHGHHLNAQRELWLEPTFLLIRDGLALLLLSFLSVIFIKHALRPALGAAKKSGAPVDNGLANWITSGYTTYEKELARSQKIRRRIAPLLVFLYALILTLFAFDHIMALDPIWISTLFGAYYFITSLFMAWAALAAGSVLMRRYAASDSPFGECFVGLPRGV